MRNYHSKAQDYFAAVAWQAKTFGKEGQMFLIFVFLINKLFYGRPHSLKKSLSVDLTKGLPWSIFKKIFFRDDTHKKSLVDFV